MSDSDRSEHTLPEVWHACSSALAGLPDDSPLLLVVDDVSWADDCEAVAIVEETVAEAPVGSTVIITTRCEHTCSRQSPGTWRISAEKLRLTDDEIAGVWRQHANRDLTVAQQREVAASTARHAALVSLMARHAALTGRDITEIQKTSSLSSLVQSLVAGQLASRDRELLDYAAVLGQGSGETLTACSLRKDASEALLRIGAALPLVSVASDGPCRKFFVHRLVGEVRGSVTALASRDRDGLMRVMEELAKAGLPARVVEVALEFGERDVIADTLRRFGGHLLKGASWELVRAGLESISPEKVASDPELLMIQAELAWVVFAKPEAIKQATLAIRLGELTAGADVPSAARSLLAGMRVSVGDFAGAIADLSPFLDSEQVRRPDDMADVLFAAILAHAFIGDAPGLSRSTGAARQLIAGAEAAPSRLARLETALGVVADVVRGDSAEGVSLFLNAARRPDVPQHRRAVALANAAMSALNCGDTRLAREVLSSASSSGTAFTTSADRAVLRALAGMLGALDGSTHDLRHGVDAVIAACEAEGESFTIVTTCILAGVFSSSLREPDYALHLGGNGIHAAAEIGSPVLLWLAELVHAQACLALGDVDRARATAVRILPLVASIGAQGHVLHARMILAEAALHDQDLAAAVEHLSEVADFIVDKSPALIVASYLRAFPDMLGPLALAMGIDRVPVRVLNLLSGPYAAEALERSATVLTPAEVARLAGRMRAEAERVAEREVAEAAAVCTVRLFGGLEVVAPRGPVSDRDWLKRKARLLFAMLVSRLGTDVPRGEIIEYLWPDMDEERALNNFYVVWSAMKHALTPGAMRDTPSPFVEHVHGVCRIVSGHVDSDLQRFGDSLVAARRARETGDVESELAALRAVSELYRGEVLPGDVYDDWFAPLRERFRHDFEDAMMRAATLLEDGGDPRAGLALLRQATSHDPWREDLYQASLRLQIAAGQRSAAIETYMSCRNRLVEDLGIDPSRETTALYEQVLGMEE